MPVLGCQHFPTGWKVMMVGFYKTFQHRKYAQRKGYKNAKNRKCRSIWN